MTGTVNMREGQIKALESEKDQLVVTASDVKEHLRKTEEEKEELGKQYEDAVASIKELQIQA
eukprot:418673-Ditylum_brightwellii.AAC.1